MKTGGAKRSSIVGEKLNIVVLDADEQERRIHAAIARRAYEIFENRGSGAHEQEDWRQAESELLRPLCLGRMSVDDSLWVSMDATHFEEGTINIWVAPHRLTICGKPRAKRQPTTPAASDSLMQEEMMFREVELPLEVDPSKVTARLKGQFLEILLRKVQVKLGQAVKAAAA
jgi:HSP20 family molecular chaperone IbpA